MIKNLIVKLANERDELLEKLKVSKAERQLLLRELSQLRQRVRNMELIVEELSLPFNGQFQILEKEDLQ